VRQPAQAIVGVVQDANAGHQIEPFTWAIVEEIRNLELSVKFEGPRYFPSLGDRNCVIIYSMRRTAVSMGGRVRKPTGSASNIQQARSSCQ
jgi:hypothetical protein